MKYIFSNVSVFSIIFKWACEYKTKWVMFESSCLTLKNAEKKTLIKCKEK